MRRITIGFLLALMAWPACAQTGTTAGSSATTANKAQTQAAPTASSSTSSSGQSGSNGSAPTPAQQDNSMTNFDVNGSSANDAMGGMH
jgi:hypothetical protein